MADRYSNSANAHRFTHSNRQLLPTALSAHRTGRAAQQRVSLRVGDNALAMDDFCFVCCVGSSIKSHHSGTAAIRGIVKAIRHRGLTRTGPANSEIEVALCRIWKARWLARLSSQQFRRNRFHSLNSLRRRCRKLLADIAHNIWWRNLRTSCLKRRRWSVFQAELNFLSSFCPGKLGHQGQREIDARGDTSSR